MYPKGLVEVTAEPDRATVNAGPLMIGVACGVSRTIDANKLKLCTLHCGSSVLGEGIKQCSACPEPSGKAF